MITADLKPVRPPLRRQAVLFAPYIVGGAILIFLPPFLPIYLQSLMTKVLIFAIFAMSLDVILGYTGLFSLGHAAYFGVAGYVTAILTVQYGIKNFWLTMPASILMATVVAAIFGIVALRVSGIYFLLVTFALGQLLFSVAIKWYSVAGGSDGLAGIPRPDLGLPWLTWGTTTFYYFVFLSFIICFFLLYKFLNSTFGHALQGIRESEPRMLSLGYNTWFLKYVAFIVAGLFAGVAGMLFTHFNGYVAPQYLGVQTSGLAMFMVIIGGVGTLSGPFIGAVVIVLVEFFAGIYFHQRWPLILGAVFVVSIMYFRAGIGGHLLGLWKKVSYRYGSIKG